MSDATAGAGQVALKPMRETAYRASRWFRVLGNPLAYQTVRCLGSGEKTVSDLAAQLGQGIKNMSHTLRHLRQVDLVRYETRGRNKVYWLKDGDVLELLQWVEARVDRMRGQAW